MEFLSLPHELIQFIFDMLEVQTQIQFRLVCKKLSQFDLTNLLNVSPHKFFDKILSRYSSVKMLNLCSNEKVTNVNNLTSLKVLNIANTNVHDVNKCKQLETLFVEPNKCIETPARILYWPDSRYFDFTLETHPKIYSTIQELIEDEIYADMLWNNKIKVSYVTNKYKCEKIFNIFLSTAKFYSGENNLTWNGSMLLQKYVNIKNDHGQTPLMVACATCHIIGTNECVKRLLTKGANIQSKNNYGENCLMICAKYCCTDTNIQCLKLLINAKIPIDNTNQKGLSALMIACKNCNLPSSIKLIKLLIKAGAQVNLQCAYGRTPLIYLVKNARTIYATECFRLLIKSGVNINAVDQDDSSALIYACTFARTNYALQIIKLLIENGANAKIHDKQHHTPLMALCANTIDCSTVDIVKSLVKTSDIDKVNYLGSNAFMYACRSCESKFALDRLKYLLELCPPHVKNTIDVQGASGVDYAIVHCKTANQLECVKMLHGLGYRSSLLTNTFLWINLVRLLNESDASFECYKFLLQFYDCTKIDDDQFSLLDVLSRMYGVLYLLKHIEFIIDKFDINGKTNALRIACKYQKTSSIECIKFLLNKGADLLSVYSEGIVDRNLLNELS